MGVVFRDDVFPDLGLVDWIKDTVGMMAFQNAATDLVHNAARHSERVYRDTMNRQDFDLEYM
jgi:hypothetical protein